jgi:hypothetical protein
VTGVWKRGKPLHPVALDIDVNNRIPDQSCYIVYIILVLRWVSTYRVPQSYFTFTQMSFIGETKGKTLDSIRLIRFDLKPIYSNPEFINSKYLNHKKKSMANSRQICRRSGNERVAGSQNLESLK